MYGFEDYPRPSFHHGPPRHGRFGKFGGPRPRHFDFDTFENSDAEFPEPPHMRGGRRGGHGPPPPRPPPPEFFSRGGDFDAYGPPPPPPPPPGAFGAFHFGGPRGPPGPPPPGPPPFGDEDFMAAGGPPRGPPPHGPPPFEFGAFASSGRYHRGHSPFMRGFRGGFPGDDFGSGAEFQAFDEPVHHRGHRGRHGRRGPPEEMFGFGMKPHGFGRHHGFHPRHFVPFDEFDTREEKPSKKVESRILETDEKYQVQILRHGRPSFKRGFKGFKDYAINYKINDDEVVLSIDSEADDFHRSYLFTSSEVEMDSVSWDSTRHALVVNIPKVNVTEVVENDKVDEMEVDGDEKPRQSKKSKRAHRSKHEKSDEPSKRVRSRIVPSNFDDVDKKSRSSSKESSSSGTTTAPASENEKAKNVVNVKEATKPVPQPEQYGSGFRLPKLTGNNVSDDDEFDSYSELSATDSE